MLTSALVVIACVIATELLAWNVLSRGRHMRPPLGVLSRGDTLVMLLAIVLVPFVYLTLPLPVVLGVFLTVVGVSIATLTSPLLACVALAADVAAAFLLGTTQPLFLAVNNVVLLVSVASVTTFWVRSGLRASNTALLCGGVAAYDFLATSLLPVTDNMLRRLADLPLAPLLAWGTGELSTSVSIGLGDVLLATLYPLAYRKAFGTRAGLVAMVLSIGCVVVLVALAATGVLPSGVPMLTVLGPITVVHYLVCRRRGPERTWREVECYAASAPAAVDSIVPRRTGPGLPKAASTLPLARWTVSGGTG
jgi:hypothetical protein